MGTTHRLEWWRLFTALFCSGSQLGIASGVLLLPGQSRFHGFRGFDAGSAHQLSRQVGVLGPQRIVGGFVQLDAIAAPGFKASPGNLIKTGSMRLQRLLQETGPFWRRSELYNKCSIHAQSISSRQKFVKSQAFFRTEGSHCFLPMARARGLQKWRS